MQERSETIGRGVNDAKANAAMLLKTSKDYEEALAKAKNEANGIFDEVKKEAEKERAQIVAYAKTEVAEMIADGKKSLEADKAKMLEEVKKEVVSLAMLATEKLLKEKSLKDLENL